jgi:GntR family transcriptional regulator
LIIIDYKSRKPIYEQLVDNINRLVLRGIYPPDYQLPSVRQLAADIGINPNTIQKAYAELERQGTIYSLTGRGSFICSDHEGLLKKYQEQKKDEVFKAVSEAAQAALPKGEIIEVVDLAYRKTEEGGNRK